jgi:hypothetical protein
MQIVHEITEGSAQSTKLFNAAHVYSSLNRKMIAPVDSQGNAQAFALNVKVYSDAANTATFATASNSYVTRQAVKAWHRVWKKSITDSGTSMKDLGPYGRVFKPRFIASDSLLGSSAEIGRGEWNHSDIVVSAPADIGQSGDIEAPDLIDQYSLHLIGSTVATTGAGDETKKFDSVGMIESWLDSRKKPLGADDSSLSDDSVDEDLVFGQDNPLLLARGGGAHSKLLLDEIRDLQKDEPPYTEADFASAYTQAMVKTNADLMAECDIVAPCGLVQVTTTAACTLVFTLVGIGDM